MASSFCCWSQRSVLSLGPPMGQLPWVSRHAICAINFFFCRIKHFKYFLTLNHFSKNLRYVYHYEIYIYHHVCLVWNTENHRKTIFSQRPKNDHLPTFWVPRQSPSIDPSIPCSTQIPSLQGSFQSNSGCLNFWKVKAEGEGGRWSQFLPEQSTCVFFQIGALAKWVEQLEVLEKTKCLIKLMSFFLFSWSVSSIGFLRFLWFYLSGW